MALAEAKSSAWCCILALQSGEYGNANMVTVSQYGPSLREMLESAIKRSDLSDDQWRWEERRVGGVAFIPLEAFKDKSPAGMLQKLAAVLSEKNANRPHGSLLKLRAALDMGPVLGSISDIPNEAAEFAFSLVEAQEFSNILDSSPGAQMLVASTRQAYETIIRSGPTNFCEAFKKTSVRLNGVETVAWIYLPESPLSEPAEDAQRDFSSINNFYSSIKGDQSIFSSGSDGGGVVAGPLSEEFLQTIKATYVPVPSFDKLISVLKQMHLLVLCGRNQSGSPVS